MGDRGLRFRSARRIAPAALALAAIGAFALLVSAPAAPGAANSAATITGEFSDSCRDFEAHAFKEGTEKPKDISHVEIQYVNGDVVKDEAVAGPDYLIDGNEGEELDFVIVKSGTTTETFTCTATNSPPTAVLERKAGNFDPQNAPGTWTSDDCAPPCHYQNPVDPSIVPDESAVSFRGTSSTDPDSDIVSWSLDFGDGTTPASGSWATEPPVEVVHDYSIECMCTAVLTVTDSAGQTSSDPMIVTVFFVGQQD